MIGERFVSGAFKTLETGARLGFRALRSKITYAFLGIGGAAMGGYELHDHLDAQAAKLPETTAIQHDAVVLNSILRQGENQAYFDNLLLSRQLDSGEISGIVQELYFGNDPDYLYLRDEQGNFVFDKNEGIFLIDQQKVNAAVESALREGRISRMHTVVQGEYLSLIAARYGYTVDELLEANPDITDKNKIAVGQKIKLPYRPVVEYRAKSSFSQPGAGELDMSGMPSTARDAAAARLNPGPRSFNPGGSK